MGATETLPMFPLGTVLFPSMLLPLRIFEPRYRVMIHDCLVTDRRFGVVLIERGHEVGGGDVRSDVGCTASVVSAQQHGDGRWLLMAMGTSRFRVIEWLADNPYPLATVEPWCASAPTHRESPQLGGVVTLFRRVLALAAELDEWSVPFAVELSDDPTVALYQMCAAAPLGAFDRQALLCCPDTEALAAHLSTLLADAHDVLLQRLATG